MSRCFPYPPPGYAGSRADGDALIMSIKLQQERERPKSEKKKDRKREKKEMRRNEKKANETLYSEKNPADKKLHPADKHGNIVHEHMEKSTLTEEHGKPCCSSESTENSTKRKRQPHIPTINNTQKQGTVIRFRLTSQKKEDPPTTFPNHAAPCTTTSGRPDFATQEPNLSIKQSTTPSLTRNATTQPTSAVNKEDHKTSTPKVDVKLPKALRRYTALFNNWATPPELETTIDDEDWLFASRQEVSPPSKKMKWCKEEVPKCAGHPWQSQAQLLGDADIYALPYAVPF